MLQELLGGGLIAGERKPSINGGILEPASFSSFSPSPSPSSPTTSTAAPAKATTTSASSSPSSNSETQNLRCPRCDSLNTKFCYYNNYNLTQPRHFCKTCRRYWTKGGALRNVPIGGGCRKNKTTTMSTPVGRSGVGKNIKATLSSELGSTGFGCGGFDYELSRSPFLLGSSQNSHLLALLNATQHPNPNPAYRSVIVKEEGSMNGSHLMIEPVAATGVSRPQTVDSEPPSRLNLCSSYWRNNQQQAAQQQNGSIMGEVQNGGIQEVFQWLRSSSSYHSNHHPAVVLSSLTASSSSPLSSSFSSSTSTVLESNPVAGGELGWNPAAFSWSDLPTNGACP